MNIGSLRIQIKLFWTRHTGEPAVSHRGRYIHGADAFGFFQGFLAPTPRNDVVGVAISVQKIHRDHGKLQPRATLQKKDVVVIRNAEKLSETSVGSSHDLIERFRAMANFHNQHSPPREGKQMAL